MAFNHRKMLNSYPLGIYLNFTIFIPCFQEYPPTPPPPPPPPPSRRDLSLLVSTSICVVGSILLLLFLSLVLYLYIKQSRQRSAATVAPGDLNRREDENETEERDISGEHHVWRITTVGLHRSAIDSITVVGFKKGEGIIDGTECSVCLNEFEEDESLRLLPKCSHAFHINCIDTWLLSHKNCPLCRAPILHTEPLHQETETNHQSASGSSNDLSREADSSGSRNHSFLQRAQSDLASHCGSRNLQTVRRSCSIGGSMAFTCDGYNTATRSSRRHFYSSFSANFFTSSRTSRNQEPVLPTRMPDVSDYCG